MDRFPAQIGRYQVRQRLGQGGMGILYLALDPAIDRLVAVKLLRTNSEELHDRFIREARSAGRLQHPNIVTIYDVGDHDGQPFLAMEYIDGETMNEIIRRRAPFPISRRLQLIEDLCAGLHYAHKAGIVHRDVKPANMIVARDGMLKILDFGIARLVDSGTTQTGALLGTPSYMSPEQIRGEHVDHRADIFAVGAVLYELLTYRQAFPAEQLVEAIRRVQFEEPTPLNELLPAIDPDLVRIVETALAKPVDARYQDLGTLQADLARVRSGTGIRSALGNDTTLVRGPAGATPRPTPGPTPGATPRPTPRPTPSPDREGYVRRRNTQIAAYLSLADSALQADDLDRASASADAAALLDPDHPETLEMLARIHDVRDARTAASLLREAESQFAAGALTIAEGLVSRALDLRPSTDAVRLQSRVAERRAQRNAEVRFVEQSLSDAHHRIDQQAFESAIRILDGVLARQPAHETAIELRRNAASAMVERERQAEEARAEAERAAAAARAAEAARAEEQARADAAARIDAAARAEAAAKEREAASAQEHEAASARAREEAIARQRADAAARERVAQEADAARAAAARAQEAARKEAEDRARANAQAEARAAAARTAAARAEEAARREREARAEAAARAQAEARARAEEVPPQEAWDPPESQVWAPEAIESGSAEERPVDRVAASRSLRRWLAVGLPVVALAAGGLWLATRGGSESATQTVATDVPGAASPAPPIEPAVEAPADSPPPATLSSNTPPPDDPSVRLAALLSESRSLLSAGSLPQAMARATAARALKNDDPAVTQAVGAILDRAAAQVATAKGAAGRVKGAAQLPSFRAGEQAERDAQRASAGQPDQALTLLADAERQYKRATDDAMKSLSAADQQQQLRTWAAEQLAAARQFETRRQWAEAVQTYNAIRDRAPDTAGLDALIATAERNRATQAAQAATQNPAPPASAPTQAPAAAPGPPPVQVQVPAAPSVPSLPPAQQPGETKPPAAPPAGPAINAEAVARGVVDRFAAAYSRKDLGEMRRLYPGIDSRTYERTFADNRTLTMTVQGCDVKGDAAQILASCAVIAERVDNFGRKGSQTNRRDLTLGRTGDDWVITAMTVR